MAATIRRFGGRNLPPSRLLVFRHYASSSVPYRTLKDDESVAANETAELPKEAEVVLVGGGVAGCALAYYLGKLGVKNVVLLEKHRLTSGSTWLTNAMLWHLRPSDLDIKLIKRTWDLAKALPKETGINTNALQNGGLFIASTKQRMEEYKRLATIGRAFGIESSILSPSDTKAQFPQVNTDDLYGTLFCPSDGSIDAAGYCTALTHAARSRYGATVVSNCAVTRIDTQRTRNGAQELVALHSTKGPIKARNVVLCAGVWSPYLLAPLGVSLPVLNVLHSYVVAGPIAELGQLPNIRDHDGNVAMRSINKHVCLGGYELQPPLASAHDIKVSPTDNTAFQVGQLDWKNFSRVVDAGMHRLPLLKQVEIRNAVCGFEAFTPDHKPLLGAVPQVRGLFVSTAFNSSGIMLSGGCAHEMAKWVINGEPDLDMFAYDVRRFNPEVAKKQHWVTERSHEAYVANYNILFKNEEPLAGRNQKKDVMHEALLQGGCVFQERFGWERPAWYQSKSNCQKAPVLNYDFNGAYGHQKHTSYRYRELNHQSRTYDFPDYFSTVKAEGLNCRKAASLFNLSSMGKFYLVGPDASRAADWLFSNQIDHKPGAMSYTLVLNKRAGIEMDATVCTVLNEPFDLQNRLVTRSEAVDRHTRKKSLYYFITVHTQTAAVFHDVVNRELEQRGFKCDLRNVTDNLCLLSIQGPNSRKVLRDLSAAEAAQYSEFPHWSHKVITEDGANGIRYRAVRFSRTGEIGWDLHVATQDALKLYERLHRCGQKYGLNNAGYYALYALAAEKGYLLPHADTRASDSPLEAGMKQLCKLQTNVDFLGRDSLLKLEFREVPKRLVCFTLRNHRALIELEGIYRNGRVVGYVQRAEFAPMLNQPIAYGYVERDLAENTLTDRFIRGGRWQIERLGTLYDADAHVTSPFDVHGDRLFDSYM